MVGITLRPEEEEDRGTLHLPRILCLHGGGTNARIFRAQCRVLEKALRPYFRLCYAQAPFSSKPGSDVVSVYAAWGPFRAWLDPERDVEYISSEVHASIQSALAEDERHGATGEVVGLLGFSQGAKICASLLAEQQRRRQTGLSTLQFAILLAGRGPLLASKPSTPPTAAVVGREAAALHRGNTVRIRSTETPNPSSASWQTMDFATLHVHGRRDPGLHLHRQFLYQNFDPLHTRLMEWDGEHRVPIKTKDVAVVVEEILSMARCDGIVE